MEITKKDVSQFAAMLTAMGAEARLRIMRLLISAHPDGMVVGEIQAELGIAASTLSHHLEKLKHAGLVTVRREHQFLRYIAATGELEKLLSFLFEECCSRGNACQTEAIVQSRPPAQGGGGKGETQMAKPEIKEIIKEKYGAAVLRATAQAACCGNTSIAKEFDPITSNLYQISETRSLPPEAVAASMGCGNPTALADLKPGETVLDLGSGGGIDVLLSARRVGPAGKAYGLDMTDEMLALAHENRRKAGVENVEFLKGEIEAIPLPDNSVDVIISNCVINLSADKDRVLSEAFRVLKPGGRFAVSDVVVRGEVPADIRRNVELWIGCMAGALEEQDYKTKLSRAGFQAIEVEPTRIYGAEDAREFITVAGLDFDAVAPLMDGKFMSAFIRARKPATQQTR